MVAELMVEVKVATKFYGLNFDKTNKRRIKHQLSGNEWIKHQSPSKDQTPNSKVEFSEFKDKTKA